MLLTILHYALAVLLLTISALVIVMNAAIVYRWLVRRKSSSLGPLLGGLTGASGCMIFPHGHLRPYWWLPLILDFGCIPLFGCTAAWLAWRWWKNRNSRPSS